VLRAASDGPLRILLPVISTASEIRRVREAVEQVARRLRRRELRLPSRPPLPQEADSLPQSRPIAPIFRDQTPSPGQACHQGWLAFLQLIDEQSPADLDIHIIADNSAKLVERCFGDLTAFITEKSFASRPRVKTSCAKSTPPDAPSSFPKQNEILFQRHH
jgi:hypothetical protein